MFLSSDLMTKSLWFTVHSVGAGRWRTSVVAKSSLACHSSQILKHFQSIHLGSIQFSN